MVTTSVNLDPLKQQDLATLDWIEQDERERLPAGRLLRGRVMEELLGGGSVDPLALWDEYQSEVVFRQPAANVRVMLRAAVLHPGDFMNSLGYSRQRRDTAFALTRIGVLSEAFENVELLMDHEKSIGRIEGAFAARIVMNVMEAGRDA